MNLRSGLYHHYKGKNYYVFKVALHSETDEPMVVYQYLYDDYAWNVRPLNMFIENIEVAGELIPRFKFIRELTDTEIIDACKGKFCG